MRAYYAHSMLIYGTREESRDLETISALGWSPFNPNDPAVDRALASFKRSHRGDYMEFYRPAVESCQVLVFRALPDGSISLGVAKEIGFAQAASIPVVELPTSVESRSRSYESTLQYMREHRHA